MAVPIDQLEEGRAYGGYTAAERAAMASRPEAIEAVFRRVPVLTESRGYEVGSQYLWTQTGQDGIRAL